MNKIVINNKINIFQEFDLVINFFDEYVGSINDFLYYIETIIYFKNLSAYNENIFLDITKILLVSEFYVQINIILELIDQISNGNQKVIDEFINSIYNSSVVNDYKLKDPNEEMIEFKSIIKNYNYYNKNIYPLIKEYVINSYIVTNKIYDLNGIVTNIIYQGQDIVIIRDYNILYFELSMSSFNFNLELIDIVKKSIDYQISILDYYYESEDPTYNLFYKQLINYNYLDMKYILNNTNIDSFG
jgi:hypothetical protein